MRRAWMMLLMAALTMAALGCAKKQADRLEVTVRLAARFNARLIKSLVLYLDKSPSGTHLGLTAGALDSGLVNGVAYTSEARDIDGDGELELAVTMEGNPFKDNIFAFQFRSPGYATVPFSVKVLLRGRKGELAQTERSRTNAGDLLSFIPGTWHALTLVVECQEGLTCINEANQPPKLEVPSDVSVAAEGTLAFVVVAEDPDGDDVEVALDKSQLPANSAVSFAEDPSIAENFGFTWSPGAEHVGGPYRVTFTADDGQGNTARESTRITVLPVGANVSPIFVPVEDIISSEGAPLVIMVEARDPDPQDVVTYSVNLDGLPAGHGAALSEGNRRLSWTPAIGTARPEPYEVLFIASDGRGGEARITVKITVLGNYSPVMETIGPQTLDEGSIREVTLKATDSDPGQSLVFCKQSGPAWAEVTGSGSSGETVTGTLTLRPEAGHEGQYAVVVRVIDGGSCVSPRGYAQETVAVTVVGQNVPPELAVVEPVAVAEGARQVAALSATDRNPGQPLTFCKVSGPAWATLTGQGISPGPVTGTLTLEPGPNDQGHYEVVVRVIDGGDCQSPLTFSEKTVQVTVGASNSPPALTEIGARTAAENFELTVDLFATDPDRDQTLTFCKESGPAWAVVTGSGSSNETVTGKLTLAPGHNDAGQYVIVVRVIDGGDCQNPTAYDEKVSVVTVDRTNSLPVLEAVAAQTLAEGETQAVALTASDPDQGQLLVFCKTSGPAWATVSGYGLSPGPVGGQLSLAPPENARGEHTVVVRLIDGGTCQSPRTYVEQTVNISVTAPGP